MIGAMTPPSLSIRSANIGDASAIRNIYAPIVENTVISFEEAVPSLAEMESRIGNTLRDYPYLVAEQSGDVVGYAYASLHRSRAAYRWSVDTTVYVADRARRSGVGRALYGDLLPATRDRGYHAAFAGITLPNPGSVGLHEAMGFRPVGIYHEVGFKFGEWHDVGWWEFRPDDA